MFLNISLKGLLSLEFHRTFDAFHHFHLRKRKVDRFEDTTKHFIDASIYVVSVLFPLMTLPQIWEIFSKHAAGGVSLPTWAWGTFFSLYWLLYGILHKDTPIVISSIVWTMINTIVIS